MKTFREFVAEQAHAELDDIETIKVAVPFALAEALDLLTEGNWQDAHISGWQYRTDPARPQMHQQAHVHVSLNKRTSSPNKQAAWNIDGSRHDKHNFNDKTGAVQAAQDIARKALRLPDDFLLEEWQLRMLAENLVIGDADAQFYFKLTANPTQQRR